MLSNEFLVKLKDNLLKKFSQKRTNEILKIISNSEENYNKEKLSKVDNYLQAFITAKQVEGRSIKTINRYRYVLMRMLRILNIPTQQITIYDLREYFIKRKNHGINDSTLEGERSIFCSYFNWLQREGLLTKNPCANLGTIKKKKTIKLPFTEVDLCNLREHCHTKRDKALIAFLLCTGCRISEVTALNRDCINFQTKQVIVVGKGNKQRTVYLDQVGAMLLKNYLGERKDTFPALFVGKGSQRLTPGGVRFLLKKIAKAAGVQDCHPHRFRRTLATNLINRGMPIQEVATILGHENINTTMTYVYVNKQNVKNSYQKFF